MSLETIVLYVASMLNYHTSLISFLGGVFGGEETAIILAIFSAQGIFNFWIFFVFFQIGTIFLDSLIFFASRSGLADKIQKIRPFSKGYKKIAELIDKKAGKNILQAMLATKFIYGTRMIMIVYLSREKLNFSKFLLYNSFVTVIWMSIIATFGWLAGKGLNTVLRVYKDINLGVSLLIAFAVLFYVARLLINKWLIKKRNL